jgi:hypothetical protein
VSESSSSALIGVLAELTPYRIKTLPRSDSRFRPDILEVCVMFVLCETNRVDTAA